MWTFFKKYISFIFNFLFHNSHDKFDRQIIVSNQINQIESWRKCRCCAWVRKSWLSLRLELTVQFMVQRTNDQRRVWYHSAIQAPLKKCGLRILNSPTSIKSALPKSGITTYSAKYVVLTLLLWSFFGASKPLKRLNSFQ